MRACRGAPNRLAAGTIDGRFAFDQGKPGTSFDESLARGRLNRPESALEKAQGSINSCLARTASGGTQPCRGTQPNRCCSAGLISQGSQLRPQSICAEISHLKGQTVATALLTSSSNTSLIGQVALVGTKAMRT